MITGDDLREALVDPSEETCKAYILMQKIRPPRLQGCIVRQGTPEYGDIVYELGMFGCYIADTQEELYNECSGYLLRSKFDKHADGGVAAGVACLDAPLLKEN